VDGFLRRWAAWGGVGLFGAILSAPCGHAEEGQEPQEDRVQRLERRMDAILREVESLRDEVARGRQRPAAADDLTKEVNQLKGRVAEVQEQAAATDAKVEQSGVRAYLGPGLVFEDPRGRWRMQVSGRAQGDYRSFTPDFADVNTFSIRRARIGMRHYGMPNGECEMPDARRRLRTARRPSAQGPHDLYRL